MAASEEKLQFRPRARIIRTIGDQLISGPEAAVIELVKNSYDADASFVSIKFKPPLEVGNGRITIVDDGIGMTLADIKNKWMEPATTSKITSRVTAMRHRRMMGSKGIGRFAAAKLGSKMALTSVSVREKEKFAVLIPEIDWNLFSGDTYLSDISIDYLTQDTDQPAGTVIEVSQLNEEWSAQKLERLYRELRRLISPLDKSTDDKFGIYLDLSECTRETTGFDGVELLGFRHPSSSTLDSSVAPPEFEVVSFPFLDTSDYEVVGFFDLKGDFHGTIEIKRGGQAPRPVHVSLPLIEGEEPCGTVSVRLPLKSWDRRSHTE
jgi:Histidine kinase-, DNA gyrase B-, and HSP90-like ATPase